MKTETSSSWAAGSRGKIFLFTSAASFLALLASVIPVLGGEATRGSQSLDVDVRVDRPILLKTGQEQDVVIKIDLTGVRHEGAKRTPLNVAVVIDRSGSMSGRKIEQARQAAGMVVDRLKNGDTFSLVSYETDVRVLVPAQRVGDKARLRRIIDRIESGGSTALYAGVEAGARQLEEYLDDGRINRVVLLSDGIANVGPSSNAEIARLGRRISQKGIAVTTVGVGRDYNEDIMAALAEASDANYYYVNDVEELPNVFAREIGELQSVVARKIVVRVTFPEGVKPLGFLGRKEVFEGKSGAVTLSQIAGEQSRYLLLQCRVNPEAFRRGGMEQLAGVEVEYENAIAEGAPREAVSRQVGIGFTERAEVAAAEIDREVVIEAELMTNALETERAIAMADQGESKEAQKVVACQIGVLCELRDKAPEAQQARIQEEINLLEKNRNEFGEAGLGASGRKALQWNGYRYRNSK
jgi:Ca-activated chloride channel family protein